MTAALILLDQADRDRFWSYVDRSGGPDACWLWLKGRVSGYGHFYAKRRVYRASHVAWELIVLTPMRPGLCLLHSCDNPPCVNPKHLSPGTQQENRQDCVQKGRHARGERTNRTCLTAQQVRAILASSDSSIVEAAKHGVCSSTVRKIRQGRNWKHVRADNLTA